MLGKSEQTILSSGQVITHHRAAVCAGEICAIHNPTDHEYAAFPQAWNDVLGVMERITPAGNVPDPDDFRVRLGHSLIYRNSAKCLRCEDEIESTYRHDFVACGCGAIFVDGGHEYLRRGGSLDDMQDTSIVWSNNV